MSSCRLLENKVALITGVNRGIGQTIMELFAQNGANIWACYRTLDIDFEAKLKSLATNNKVSIKSLHFDLANEQQIKDSLRPLLKNRDRIDILVNNAGVAHGSFFQMTSIQQIRDIFNINFFSQLLITQLVTKLMKKQQSGSVINLASIAGIDPEEGFIAYGSSKAALIYATKTLAMELGPDNIRVNAIAPGLTDTSMARQMEVKAKERMINQSSMKRLATPDEIAKVTLFLASDNAQFINGQLKN